MKKKKTYIAPHIEVILVETESILEPLSLPINNNSSDEGGDAKGGFFDDDFDEEIENSRPWGDISY